MTRASGRELGERTNLSWMGMVLGQALGRQTLKEKRFLQRRKLKTAGGTRPSKLNSRQDERVARSDKLIAARSKIKDEETPNGISQFTDR
jgi:hypothetical protein